MMKLNFSRFASLLLAFGVFFAQGVQDSRAGATALPCDGKSSCKIDGFAVSSGGCGKDALFGSIVAQDGAKGVDLDDRIDGQGEKVARLADHQFVCIAATARDGDSQRHYVVAIPTASVSECKGNALCKGSDLPIEWKKATTGKACERVGDGKYVGDCAAGWVEEGYVDQYANGL